jgi:hypothetical protein
MARIGEILKYKTNAQQQYLCQTGRKLKHQRYINIQLLFLADTILSKIKQIKGNKVFQNNPYQADVTLLPVQHKYVNVVGNFLIDTSPYDNRKN